MKFDNSSSSSFILKNVTFFHDKLGSDVCPRVENISQFSTHGYFGDGMPFHTNQFGFREETLELNFLLRTIIDENANVEYSAEIYENYKYSIYRFCLTISLVN